MNSFVDMKKWSEHVLSDALDEERISIDEYVKFLTMAYARIFAGYSRRNIVSFFKHKGLLAEA
jgi:hypothetical protein